MVGRLGFGTAASTVDGRDWNLVDVSAVGWVVRWVVSRAAERAGWRVGERGVGKVAVRAVWLVCLMGMGMAGLLVGNMAELLAECAAVTLGRSLEIGRWKCKKCKI